MNRIAVLMGGRSTEKEISLKTGRAVAAALAERGYDVAGIDTAQPDWTKQLDAFRPDVVFIGLHGKGGEDGTVQGYLETKGYAFTGSCVLGSAVAMNKIFSQQILRASGLPVPEFLTVRNEEYSGDSRTQILDRLERIVGYPMVVKAPSQGSTIGIHFVHDRTRLQDGLEAAFALEDHLIVERMIQGMEVTVSVMGNHKPFPLATLEITTTTGCYDYETKYTPGMSQHIIPARLPAAVRNHCRDLAQKAYRALCMNGFGRVDFMLDDDLNPYILEANTIPGMTETSLIPDAARHLGMEFDELVELICFMALGCEFPAGRKDTYQW